MFAKTSRYHRLTIVASVLLLLALLPGRARSLGHEGDRVVSHAAGQGDLWTSLLHAVDLPATYSGAKSLTEALEARATQPLSLTAADFDEDGVPDLVSGYAHCGLAIADCGLKEDSKSEIRNCRGHSDPASGQHRLALSQ